MAIDLFSGTPGSGKSLHAAKQIVEWAQAGKPVITNFEVDLSRYPKANQTYVEDDELTPDYLLQFSRAYFAGRKLTKKDEDTILLVIDECQLLFNSRDYQKKDRKSWIKLFSTHRHLGYHVILIAQMDKMLDKQIRGLIEYEFVHRKLSNFGKAGKLLTVLLAGEMFTAVQMWYPLKMKIGTKMFRAKRKYYRIYDSYAAFGEPKPLPAPAQSADVAVHEALPQEENTAPELDPAPSVPDPEVKVGEVIDAAYEEISPKASRSRRRSRYSGKFLRSSKFSETGWRLV